MSARRASARWGACVLRLRLAACIGLIGCANGAMAGSSDPLPGESAIGLGRGETLPSFTPAETAERNWDLGEAAFAAKNHLLAQRFYIFIRRKFPYSNFAVLSDLRIADCQFERERLLEAIDGYRNFVRLHPTHPKVAYAMFRVGVAHWQLVPNDWFFLPPSHEKDQGAIRDAAESLAAFLRRFPEDENAEEAKKKLAEARSRLMDHDRYVADFYEREGKIRGYVGRLEHIKREFADVGLDAKLLLEIVMAYVRLEDRSSAAEALTELEKAFPNAPELARAKAAVAKLPAN